MSDGQIRTIGKRRSGSAFPRPKAAGRLTRSRHVGFAPISVTNVDFTAPRKRNILRDKRHVTASILPAGTLARSSDPLSLRKLLASQTVICAPISTARSSGMRKYLLASSAERVSRMKR